MGSVNKVLIIGYLGADPELRYTPSGNRAVCNLSVATSEAWKDKGGQKQERTEWHRVQVWGDQTEACAKYLKKGSQAYIEGKLQTRQWEDKSGQKRYTTEIVASHVVFLGSASGESKSSGKRWGDDDQQSGGSGGKHREERYSPPPSDDDVPF